MIRVFKHIVLVLILGVLPCWSQQGDLRQTVEFMASLGSRVSGYPGADRAASYVETAMRSMASDVEVEEFELAVPVDRGGSIQLVGNEETYTLWSLWPNSVRTSTISPSGYEGEIIYGGNGTYRDLSGKPLDGVIVLMEFNTWDDWLKAASLGARAVIFIEPEESTEAQAREKFSSAPLDIPRFWIGREDGLALRGQLEGSRQRALLKGRMDWKSCTGRNLWVRFPGSDPDIAGETIIIEAYYDGISIVPGLAPSAEMSSSIAALLAFGDYLKSNPPARTVILVATDAHFQGQRGMADFLDRHARKLDYYAKRMQEPLYPHLFISLDLTTQTDQLGLWNNTNSYDLKRFFVPFGRRFVQYNEELAPILGRDPARSLINGISPIRGMDWDTFVPGGVSVNSMKALDAGIVSLALVTVNDGRFTVNTPFDSIDKVNFENLGRQSALINGLLGRAINDPNLFADLEDFTPVLKDNLRSLRTKVRAFPRRSQVPDRPIPGALVVARPGFKPHKGVHWSHYHFADEKGEILIRGLKTGATGLGAFLIDETSGDITYAPDLSTRAQNAPTAGWIISKSIRWQGENKKTIVLFPSISTPFYGLIDPRSLGPFGEVKVMDASGVAPRQYGMVRGLREPVGVLFSPLDADEGAALKMVVNNRMLLVNSTGSESEEAARGVGFDIRRDKLNRTGMLILRDMWNLNEARLRTMRAHAIENQRLTRLHESGKAYWEEAEKAEQAYDWETYVSNIRAGLGVTTSAYPEVMATLNDVIKGIVFFLALVIPSAFFGERLIFAAADVRKQLLGFFLLLFLIWMVIAQVHPAFSIAHPLVVLLAFAIMAMAALVLSMIMSRFNRFMKEYQSKEAHVHETDISRASASYAAFMLGISNMRRRKMRTGLTLLTLVLLTFTVLSFTSFNAQVRFLAFSMDHEGAYEGVLIRDRNWSEINEPTLEYARSHFEKQGLIVPRNWYMAFDDEQKKYIEVERNGEVVRATGMLGLASAEEKVTGVNKALVAGTFFGPNEVNVCLISEEMAQSLGIDPTALGEASVQIFGRELIVRGIFSSEEFEAVRDLDDEPLTPADFQMSSAQALGPDAGDNMTMEVSEATLDVKPFVHLEAANIVVLPFETLKEAGGTLRSVAVRFGPDVQGQTLLEDFLLRLSITLFAGLSMGGEKAINVFSYTSMGMTNVEGLGALIIPMFIAALIVLNAMMGAVYERFREIGIYSSVGLAPMHIALLFVAEAVVYAIIGVTLGYIMGQGLGKVLIYFNLLQGMNLNYSSWSAIVSSLLVMGVVLLSTIYPAKIAAKSSVPDTVRRWIPPDPDGDRWEFEFPFMVSEAEVRGLCGFLANYFNSYSEESIGDFYAEKVRIVAEDGRTGTEYGVQLLLWLAPFDMGVSQFMQLEFLPTNVSGVYTVEIYIERISGQDTFWQRVNKRFINGLRKEFLLWHTLPDVSKTHHRKTADQLLVKSLEEPAAESA